jgi:saccharopine dehydrogenase-like NADP-dependent oxidoreductase
MTKRVLIIGGYGNFGQFIAKKLAQDSNIQLIIAGRDEAKAVKFCKMLHAVHNSQSAKIDIRDGLKQSLSALKPDIVIHTSGPFQEQGYHVASACIEQGCHYIDLADAREFVAGITVLDKAAKAKGVLICSGASSVPCLTGGIVDHYKGEFQKLESLEYGIATAQLTNRGLATTLAVLSYAGKPFKTLIDGKMQDVYGWLDLRARRFWGLNNGFLGNCDIPDLGIFPARYPSLKSIRFQAGLELKGLHLILWALSGLVKLKLLPSLQPVAPYLLKISRVFDSFGHDDSGFYMTLRGIGKDNCPKEISFQLVARRGDGLYIPSMPAILLAKKLANSAIAEVGAYPCLGFISLDEYLVGLSEFDIEWQTT